MSSRKEKIEFWFILYGGCALGGLIFLMASLAIDGTLSGHLYLSIIGWFCVALIALGTVSKPYKMPIDLPDMEVIYASSRAHG